MGFHRTQTRKLAAFPPRYLLQSAFVTLLPANSPASIHANNNKTLSSDDMQSANFTILEQDLGTHTCGQPALIELNDRAMIELNDRARLNNQHVNMFQRELAESSVFHSVLQFYYTLDPTRPSWSADA